MEKQTETSCFYLKTGKGREGKGPSLGGPGSGSKSQLGTGPRNLSKGSGSSIGALHFESNLAGLEE